MRCTRILSPLVALPLAVALTACASGTSGTKGDATLQASKVPAAIAVPSGSRLAFTLRASGLQNYECRSMPAAAGGYGWTAVSPEAALYDRSDALVGRVNGGPTFEYGDDSKATGKVLAESPATEPASVSWALLQATPAPRNGVMSGVSYIQRVNTQGGVAPSDACSASAAGARKGVRYTADYLFYKG